MLSIATDDVGRVGRVDFGGVVREVRLDFVPGVEVDEYVVVHVGFAISKMDTDEADRRLALLEELAEVQAS